MNFFAFLLALAVTLGYYFYTIIKERTCMTQRRTVLERGRDSGFGDQYEAREE
ncbi:MAG: hypothetical protein H6Q73_1661 [Firmicutes bacterium]|nr:hypothetical protein [Bacillota bacterium]